MLFEDTRHLLLQFSQEKSFLLRVRSELQLGRQKQIDTNTQYLMLMIWARSNTHP